MPSPAYQSSLAISYVDVGIGRSPQDGGKFWTRNRIRNVVISANAPCENGF